MKKIIGVMLSLVIIFASITISTKSVQAATVEGYVWPIEGQIFARGFSSEHEALDIEAGVGVAVKSINQGTVFCASMASTSANAYCSNCGHIGAGYHVAIQHPNGIKAMYAHLSYVCVSNGQAVSAGQQIGNVGSTGNSTGPHLHLAVFKNGFSDAYAVDPLTYLTPFSNVYATDITNTSATIHGVFGAYGPTMTAAGIYIGTNPNNLTKITETLNTNGYDSNGNALQGIFYGTQKWYGTLKAGTTYYYKVWITRFGIEYISDLKSFTTTGGHTHSWGSWVTNKLPTCETEGQKIRTCSCGAKETKSEPALGHKFPEQTITDEHGNSTEIIETVTCERCTEQKQYIIPANPHKFLPNYWTTDKQPTCTEAGEKSIHCIYVGCNYRSRITEIPALGHTCEEWDVIKEATCTQTGIKVGKCSVCGGKDEKEIAVAPHNYNSIYFNPATCNSGGERVAKCDTCAYKSVTEIKGGHFYKNGKCVTCNIGTEVVESAHTYDANSNYTWIVTKVGADHLSVAFSEETETEEKYDIIYIYDGNDNLIGEYSGKELSGKNINILSDTVKIKLLSDNSFQKYGFYAVVTPKSNEGDINGDGGVNADDILNVRFSILSENSNMIYDINNDGKVNVKDLVKIKKMIAIGNIIPVPPAFDLVG